jgi:hypothetical protein
MVVNAAVAQPSLGPVPSEALFVSWQNSSKIGALRRATDLRRFDGFARLTKLQTNVSDENRDRQERRRKERQREEEERRRKESAENGAIYHEGLRSGDHGRWLARRGYASPPHASEVSQGRGLDEASVLAAGPFDKQVWQQEALEAIFEAQQSLWASILHLSGPHNSPEEKAFLSNLITVTTLSADDENALSTIDQHILSSEMNYRFSDLSKDLRWLRSKVEDYRLVREIVERGD